VAAAACLACASANPFEGGVYRDGKIAFRIPSVPDGWQRIAVGDANLAFRDEAREASILVDGQCDARQANTPLVALTTQLVIGTTEREYVSEETIQFDEREARHTVLRAKLDGVVMQYDIYVLNKDGCVYDLVYVAPPSRFPDGAPRFEQFASGFHTMGTGAL
jgi:hypothetical protein